MIGPLRSTTCPRTVATNEQPSKFELLINLKPAKALDPAVAPAAGGSGDRVVDRRRFLLLVAGLSGCSPATRPPAPERMVEFPVVIRGGRVIDPGQGLDMSVDVAIEDARVAAIGPGLRGRIVLDAAGCVVAPGFIDLHSHAQTIGSHRLQAFDGVTTTLELEAGALPVAAAYTRAGGEGRPLNYGYSASWASARVRRAGAVVTTEAYPYGAGVTGVGAAFPAPERLAQAGLRPTDLVYAPTNERVRDAEHLRSLRAADPGGGCIIHFLDETKPADAAVIRAALVHEDTMVASDAIPLTGISPAGDWAWPLPPGARTHPRTAGTFARSFRRLVGEGALSLPEFVRRASLLPARVLATAVGGTARKGTLAVGADADIVVFEPDAFRDQATYEVPTRPSTGVRHLVVGGEPVIRDGALELYARPGRPLRRS